MAFFTLYLLIGLISFVDKSSYKPARKKRNSDGLNPFSEARTTAEASGDFFLCLIPIVAPRLALNYYPTSKLFALAWEDVV
jgi:hypothetical protein